MTRESRSVRIITLSLAAAAVLGAATLGTAQAAESPAVSAKSTASRSAASQSTAAGIPASVNAATDLASKGPGAGPDSIYVTSHVKAHGHTFGILVQTVNVAEADQRSLTVSVTDETTGWYKNYQVPVAKDQYTWSTSGLEIKAPGLSWIGNEKKMSVQATTPWGALSLDLEATGPALNYAGTGEWEMFGSPQYEFALPSLRTTGTLTIAGKTSQVSGESWLDRQWGQLPLGPSSHWTWMNLSLSNGDRVAIWDTVSDKAENSWATVMHPDGSYELVAVKPLAEGADKTWTSPSTGTTYPSRWHIDIPALRAHLTVQITGTNDQELVFGKTGRVEATASVTGAYEGKRVTGWNYVEMVGNPGV